MSDPTGLVKVIRTLPFEAVCFDGTKAHADALIAWIRAAHGHEISLGHVGPGGTLFQPLRSGAVLRCDPGWWIVQHGLTEFIAYAPPAFASEFEVVL